MARKKATKKVTAKKAQTVKENPIIQWVKISELKPNPNNTNKHPKAQIDRLARLIEFQGWRVPIIARASDKMIAAGHGRYQAAKKLKLKMVPVSFQEFETEDQFKAFVTSDNAIAAWAELDLDAINAMTEDLDVDFDLDMLGLEDFQTEFDETTEEQQGKLDEKRLIIIECPECGAKFEHGKAKIED